MMNVVIMASIAKSRRIMLVPEVEFSALKLKNTTKKARLTKIAKYETVTHLLDS